MAVTRYILYFLCTALMTWVLTRIEIASPGSLQLQIYTHADDLLGSEVRLRDESVRRRAGIGE